MVNPILIPISFISSKSHMNKSSGKKTFAVLPQNYKEWSEFLAAKPEVLGSFPGATRFSG
jgi:hypothetical protein